MELPLRHNGTGEDLPLESVGDPDLDHRIWRVVGAETQTNAEETKIDENNDRYVPSGGEKPTEDEHNSGDNN